MHFPVAFAESGTNFSKGRPETVTSYRVGPTRTSTPPVQAFFGTLRVNSSKKTHGCYSRDAGGGSPGMIFMSIHDL